MDGNLLSTLLALLLYLTSGIFGGGATHSGSSSVQTSPSSYQSHSYPRVGSITATQANLRSSAGAGGSIVATLPEGARVTILAENASWVLVESSSSQTGWVAKYLVGASPSSLSLGRSRKVIAGYYVENSGADTLGYRALLNNVSKINTIIPFAFKVNQYGVITGNHPRKPSALADSAGTARLALVNNIQSGNFSSNTIHQMLTSATARSRAINGISRILIEKGYQGVNIDFENVPARDRMYLNAFFRELALVLRTKGLSVTASVPAKTYNDRTSPHAGAYDYQAIAPYLDQVMVMAYDEHYAGGIAGPVASYPWVERVINYTLRHFPASKIVIGIAGYGYDWVGRSGKAKHFNAISNLIRRYRTMPHWHPVYRVPYFTYRSWGIKHEVWYEDSRSTAAKMGLIRKYQLRGVAVWRLGYEDPAIWRVIQEELAYY